MLSHDVVDRSKCSGCTELSIVIPVVLEWLSLYEVDALLDLSLGRNRFFPCESILYRNCVSMLDDE